MHVSSSSAAAASATNEQEESNGLSELVSIVSFPALQPAQFSADRLSFSEQVCNIRGVKAAWVSRLPVVTIAE